MAVSRRVGGSLRRGKEERVDDEMEISSGFISHGKSTGARNDRGITNGEGKKRAELAGNGVTTVMQKGTKCRQVLHP